jgi:erythromycin esterase-like protein
MGDVLAARKWKGRRQIMHTPRPRPDSLEAAFLAGGWGDRLVVFDRDSRGLPLLQRRLPHRAIGVVFDPRSEPSKNYIPTRLAQCYDAFVFLPYTQALEPLPVD